MTIDPEAVVVERRYVTYPVPGGLEYREVGRPAPAAFCTECEFAIEIGRPVVRPYPEGGER